MKKKLLGIVFVCFLVSSCSIWSKITYFWSGDFLKVDVGTSIKRWKLSPEDRKLVKAFFYIDVELEDILTKLQILDRSNFEKVSKKLVDSHPWIVGIYSFNSGNNEIKNLKKIGAPVFFSIKDCEEVFKEKQIGIGYFVKSKHYSSILTVVERELRGDGTANYKVIGIDMNKLVGAKCNLFQRLAIIGKKNVIVANGLDIHLLSQISFNDLLKKSNKGRIRVKDKILYWMVRFIGNDPMFYVLLNK